MDHNSQGSRGREGICAGRCNDGAISGSCGLSGYQEDPEEWTGREYACVASVLHCVMAYKVSEDIWIYLVNVGVAVMTYDMLKEEEEEEGRELSHMLSDTLSFLVLAHLVYPYKHCTTNEAVINGSQCLPHPGFVCDCKMTATPEKSVNLAGVHTYNLKPHLHMTVM